MREDRLLERIRKINEGQVRGGGDDHTRRVNSVLAYIAKILNTRQGSVPIGIDFGLPDYSTLATRFFTDSTETVDNIEEAIVSAIEKYEPRLSSVRVQFIVREEDNLILDFEVSAQIMTDSGLVPIVLKTSMSPEGETSVSI